MVKSIVVLALSMVCAVSAHAASMYDWRVYPNGGRAVVFEYSAEWLLLERDQDAPTDGLEAAIAKAGPNLQLVDHRRLLPQRVAIQVIGSDLEGLRRLGESLVAQGQARQFWPVGTRQNGLGFFDDMVAARFDDAPSPAMLIKSGVRLVSSTILPGVYRLRALDGDGIGAAWALKSAGALWAEPDLIRDFKTTAVPNDPLFDTQWHLEDANDVDINASTAWDTTSGDPSVVVGVFDSGFDLDHPDLVDNIVGGFDAANNDSSPEAECTDQADGRGRAPSCPGGRPYRESHGTSVAGVIAARGNNELGVTGICPDCSIYPVRLLGNAGRGLTNAAAFQRATDDGVSIINNSWGPQSARFFPLSDAERTVFDRITHEGRDGKGVVILFAAGNEYFTPVNANPYATHPGVITVSASTRSDDFACYSNYGSTIAVAGPSQGCFPGETGISTTDYAGEEGYGGGDYNDGFGGTSAASPVVAGVTALMLSANPNLTAEQVRLMLQESAIKIIGDKNPWEQQFGVNLVEFFAYDENGFSQGFGYGRVDAARAVAKALAPSPVGGLCDDDCERCIDDRCAPTCEEDAECPGASRCVAEADGSKGCRIPPRSDTETGGPCNAECDACVSSFNSEMERSEICTNSCEDDEDCVFGFDCRTIGPNQPRLCIPGNKECGAPWGDVRCQSGLRVEGPNGPVCACDCAIGGEGACPESMECANVFCEQIRETLFCSRVASAQRANYFPTCVPSETYEAPCEIHRDCRSGQFCIEGTCQIDQDAAGCTLCAPCSEDSECGFGSACVGTARGRRCLEPCTDDAMCPADSVCAAVPGTEGMHCVNPEYARKGVCPEAYRCMEEGRCYADSDCDDGISCVDNTCDVPPPEPDAGIEADAAPMAADMGVVSEADAEPVSEDTESGGKKDSGCSATPGSGGLPAAWSLGLLGLLALRRRRGDRLKG